MTISVVLTAAFFFSSYLFIYSVESVGGLVILTHSSEIYLNTFLSVICIFIHSEKN